MREEASKKIFKNVPARALAPFYMLAKDFSDRRGEVPYLYEVGLASEGVEGIFDTGVHTVLAKSLDECEGMLEGLCQRAPEDAFIGGHRIEVLARAMDDELFVRYGDTDAVCHSLSDVTELISKIFVPEVASGFIVTTKTSATIMQEETGERPIFFFLKAATHYVEEFEAEHPGETCILMPAPTSDPLLGHFLQLAFQLDYQALDKEVEYEVTMERRVAENEQVVRKETDEFGNIKLTF